MIKLIPLVLLFVSMNGNEPGSFYTFKPFPFSEDIRVMEVKWSTLSSNYRRK